MPKPMTVEFRGAVRTLAEVSKMCGISARTLRARITTHGYDIERAATTPIQRRSDRGGRPAANAPRPVPEFKRHPSGRAYSRWKAGGKTHERYFGRHGTPEAADKYRRFAADWSAGKYDPSGPDGKPGGRVSLGVIVRRWLDHCERYYVKDGKPTSEAGLCKIVGWLLVEQNRTKIAEEFGPGDLRAFRQSLITRKLSRNTCNGYTARALRCFQWAAGAELIPATIPAALALVETLKPGRSEAADRPKKKPTTDAQIVLTIPELWPGDPTRAAKYVAMIRLQRLTGMRPGEVCALAPADLEPLEDGGVWKYTVGAANKNRHRGRAQVYYFGPKAVEALRPFLEGADPLCPVFGETVNIYGHQIGRASVRAGCGRWSPHQLRHALATEVARVFRSGAHAAAAIGDSEAVANAVYVHVDPREKAKIEVARRMG
jgi:integrase